MDRRSFPTTTDTRKLVRAVDAATDLGDQWIGQQRYPMCQQFHVTTRFQEGEFRQHQIKRNSSGPPTCPASRAQTANFALTLDMSATSSQLIWTAVTENTRLSSPVSQERTRELVRTVTSASRARDTCGVRSPLLVDVRRVLARHVSSVRFPGLGSLLPTYRPARRSSSLHFRDSRYEHSKSLRPLHCPVPSLRAATPYTEFVGVLTTRAVASRR